MNEKNIIKIIRMPLPLYRMTGFQKKIAGNVSNELLFQFTNQHIHVEVTGKKVNRDVGLRLEIPVNYFYSDARVITWVKNSLEKLDNEFHVKVKKCVK